MYNQDTSFSLDSYYQVDLVNLLELNDPETFKYFYLFFRRKAFEPFDSIQKSHKLLSILTDCIRFTKFVIKFTSKVKDIYEKTPSVEDDIQIRVLKFDKRLSLYELYNVLVS